MSQKSKEQDITALPTLTPQPGDTVSKLAWSSKANLVAASSWDKQVRIWEVDPSSGRSQGKLATGFEAPVLTCAWSPDGSRIIAGGCDKKVFFWDLASNKTQQIGQHDAPVNFAQFVPEINCVVSGSWDKTLRFWDGRQSSPVMGVNLPERLYSGDIRGNIGVFGTADRKIVAYDMTKPQQPAYVAESPLKFQTRVVRLFTDNRGFAVGSIEGRVAIQYFDKAYTSGNFAFKCHRVNNAEIYAVNDIAFSHFGTFVTMGSDGSLHFWDKDSKQRLKAFTRGKLPVVCGAFNHNSSIFAYAVGYDWSRGAAPYGDNAVVQSNQVHVYGVSEADIKPRSKK